MTTTVIEQPGTFEYVFDGDNVELLLNGERVELTSLLEIPQDTYGVREAMGTHAGLMVWFGVAMADAEADAALTKELFEVTAAEVAERMREEAIDRGEKVPSEAYLDRVTKIQPDYLEAMKNKLFAARKAAILKTVYESFRTRGQLLAGMNATIRDENRQPYANTN